jgi:hypothetical protein
MIVKGIATIALAFAPALVAAQGNEGGRQGRPGQNGGRRGGAMVSAADVQKRDPIAFLLDKHKSLKLTDEQTSAMKQVDADMNTELAASYKQLDSIRALMRPPAGASRESMSDEQREQMRSVRRSYGEALKVITDRYDAGVTAALEPLGEEQRAKATKMLEERRQEMMREMPRGRRPGGGGGGGGSPR